MQNARSRMKRGLVIFVTLLILLPSIEAAAITTVDFEDDPQIGLPITCNPDFGIPFECDPSHHEWLQSKGIDITGTPNGFVWSTEMSGPIGITGVVIGFASPSHLEQDEGLSDNEVLTVHFLDALVSLVEIKLTVIPSDSPLINNVPATVIMNAFDSDGNLIATTTKTFTGVTDGVLTPATIGLSVASKEIAQITLEASKHPYGGVWLESITSDTPSPVTVFLHDVGGILFLDSAAPTTTTPDFNDSAAVRFSGGNPWTEIGTWTAAPADAGPTLAALGDFHGWLGLKNSDDIGTRFDLRAEVLKDDAVVASGETFCITGVTRNPSLAKEALVSFAPFSPASFNGTTDALSLKVFTRIGTNGAGTFCGGHSNAVGARLYFDAVGRPSRFDATFQQ